MIEELKHLLAVTDRTDLDHLKPLVQAARTQGVLTVVTLNYDRTVETLCEREGIPFETGFGSWVLKGALDLEIPSGVRLLKLHGSLDWSHSEQRSPGPGLLPVPTYQGDAKEGRPVIVFGEQKLRHDGPFLDLLLALDHQLASATRLVVVGYSFRDDHVNDRIRRWINASSARSLVVIDPAFHGTQYPTDGTPSGFQDELMMHLLPPDDSLRAPAFAPRLQVLPSFAGEGLASLAWP